MKTLIFVALVCGACGNGTNGQGPGSGHDAAVSDAAMSDAAMSDAAMSDAAMSDAAVADAAVADAAVADAPVADAAVADAAVADAAVADAAVADAAVADAAVADAAVADAAVADAAVADAVTQGPIRYTDPSGGKLRLIKSPTKPATDTTIVLELVVGSQPLTGYSVGFDLPLDDTRVKLNGFTPGTALSAGTAPVAALAVIRTTGPLAHHLVAAQSQKASGTGAVTTDTTLAAGTSLYSIELGIIGENGVVFDGTAPGFVLTSGGLRNRVGNSVVDTRDVAIGRLEVNR
jgi:hypothetical protein